MAGVSAAGVSVPGGVQGQEPSQVGPYRVVRLLGAGGMGRVYLATSASGRAVAVKVVRPELSGDAGFRRRFKAEVDAARAVSGAFTTPVVDADPEGPLPWLATAYVPGPSLQSAVETHGPMPESTLRVLGAGLAEALVAIHRAGLIHRDLKPSNILLAADGPRVIDFGISRAIDATALTADGQVVGSAGYMSPEHVAGRELTPASDVFALGAVLAFAATGSSPFGTGSFHVLMFRARHEPPQLDRVPPGLAGIVAACLDKDPSRRPTPERLQSLLGTVSAAPGWLPPPLTADLRERERTMLGTVVAPSPFSRRRLLIGGGAVLAAAAVSGTAAAVLLRQGGTRTVTPTAAWTGSLPNPDMSLAAATDTTLVGTAKSGAAGVDLATGRLLWQSTGGEDTSVRTDGRRVYALRTDGKLHALDGRTGRPLWAVEVAAGKNMEFERLTPTMIVMSAADNSREMYGVDPATGQRRWTHRPPSNLFMNGLKVSKGGLMIMTDRGGGLASFDQWQQTGNIDSGRAGSYYALDTNTGQTRWSKNGSMEAVYAAPEGDLFYAFDKSMNLVALRPDTGDPVWQRPSGLRASTTARMLGYDYAFTLHGDTLVCYPSTNFGGSKGGLIAAFDAKDGRRLWSFDTSSNEGDYAITGKVLCYLDGGSLRAVGLRTGERLWEGGGDLGKITLNGPAGDLFLVGTRGSRTSLSGLHGLDAVTGKRVWHLPLATPDPVRWWISLRTDGRLVVGYDGRLFGYTLPGKAPRLEPF
ncbi:PQQ-binding-like beta-propeller repeat protein [Spirillospora sp. NPDC047279]|uniref:protein kinase domain-containing protein n=1 Tax=Spirillospora sp. NPDC047279 TaxID=3155478 RepID=UPI0033DFCFA7